MAGMSAAELFSVLDGRTLIVSSEPWKIEVYSVSEEAGEQWVQLAVRGNDVHTIILKVRPGDDEPNMLTMLTSWLADPGRPPQQVLLYG